MKNKIFIFCAAVAAALGFTACTDDTWNPQADKEGMLLLSSLGVDVNTYESVVSRAEGVDVNSFIVTITKGGEEVKSWKYSEMPEVVTLPEGDYSVVAESHKVERQAWDAPYYKGSADFSIAKNKITEVGTITCKFSSVKVTVAFDSKLIHMENEKVTVVANDQGTLDFDRSTVGKAGYFEAVEGSNTLVATFTATIDGAATTLTNTYSDVAPGKHYRLLYSIKSGNTDFPEENGSLDKSGIALDVTIQTVDAEGNVVTEEDTIKNPGDRPGKEEEEEPVTPDPGTDPGESNTITFSSTTLDFAGENSVNVSEALVKIHSEHGFAHLNVNIGSDNAEFLGSAGELMPLSFDLATVEGETAGNLESIGLPVGPYPADQTDIDFNITELVPLLGAFPGHHAFDLSIEDNQGNKKSLTLKFVAE